MNPKKNREIYPKHVAGWLSSQQTSHRIKLLLLFGE